MIRKAKQAEILPLIEITKACTAYMISQNIFQWNAHYPNSKAFEKDCDREELYVLYNSEMLVGCITVSTFKDPEYEAVSWLTEDGTQYYIHRLAIHPNFQKQGYAKLLMDFAEGLARKNNAVSVRLDTFSQNTRNQRFYEHRGYKRLGDIYFPKQSEYPFYCYELIL